MSEQIVKAPASQETSETPPVADLPALEPHAEVPAPESGAERRPDAPKNRENVNFWISPPLSKT